MDIELLCLVNGEARKIRTKKSRIPSIVREHPDTKFYCNYHNGPLKEWLIYTVHQGKVISYPALIKPVKLLTYLLLTDV